MDYTDEIYEAAAAIKGAESAALRRFCSIAAASVTGRLREGVSASDFSEVFIGACAMLAAALDSCGAGADGVSSWRAGEVSVTKDGGLSSASALREQAEAVLAPYICDNGFIFTGVVDA